MDGYTSMFTTETATFNFKQWAANSIFVAFLTTIFSMIIAVLGGYGISRYRFKGRGALSYIVLTTQVLPGSLLMIPLYIIMSNLGLLNTKIGLMLAYVTFTVPFCTWMMKGFFDSIPISLEEAARVDGAGTFRCFFTVTLPLTVPGLVSTGLFAFINGWNEYLFASSFMQSYDNWTLPVGIASFKGQYATDWGTLMAGSVLITIPVVILSVSAETSCRRYDSRSCETVNNKIRETDRLKEKRINIMELKQIRMGIVGAGTWGATHASIYAEHICADPVAICDMNKEKAQAIADKYGIRKVYTDYKELAADPEIDAVAIVTPDFAHADIACAMADAGKDILIEKPLATTREDIDRICEAVERNGVRCMVDLHNRWNAPFNKAKQEIASGKLGKPYTAYIRHSDVKWVATDMLSWAAKSSILWFLGSHSLDSLRWLVDSEAKRVYSVKRGRTSERKRSRCSGYLSDYNRI